MCHFVPHPVAPTDTTEKHKRYTKILPSTFQFQKWTQHTSAQMPLTYINQKTDFYTKIYRNCRYKLTYPAIPTEPIRRI